ncbi:MAG: DUF4846 domain-containing protein [bacterium]|nr:DUF4846 domain-containing protein [bacterium]
MRKNRIRVGIVVVLAVNTIGMAACQSKTSEEALQETEKPVVTQQSKETEPPKEEKKAIIQSSGVNLNDRFAAPTGYTKDAYKKDSFGAFVRNYSMQKDKAKVHLYDGREKGNQSSAAAVFSMKVGDRDLQQCADSVIRMYAEYFYETKQYDHMNFHFVDGFECSYKKWSEGYRVAFSNEKASWKKSTGKDTSYESFEKYLTVVFAYASTISLEKECKEIKLKDVKIGDVFINAGSPGHVVMVVDVCTNQEGKKAVLLAQGYMPAQEFHVITNPRHSEDPWYYEDEIKSPFQTAEYTFTDSVCKRPQY